jgi:hypothetical protein
MSASTSITNASIFEIPLSPQQQSMAISLNGVTYNLTFNFRDSQGTDLSVLPQGWVMDLADQNGNLMIGAIPLVTGSNLLGQFAYLGIGGALFVYSDGTPDDVPTYANLGVSSHLVFVPGFAT